MGYTVSLGSSASQTEGSGGSPASFTFNLTRDAGDGGETTYKYEIRNANDLGLATSDFASASSNFTWNAGVLTTTLTLTATADTTVESDESFVVWIYRNSGVVDLFYQSSAITLVNDDVGAPVFATTSFNAAENGTAIGTVSAAGGGTVTYALNGGADAALFSIDANTGVLTFTGNQNYEAPGDAGANRVYDVTVRATAGGLSTDQAITVNLTNVNEAITITSDGGGPTAAVNVAENSTAVTTGTTTDIDAGDTVAWSITGGADAAKFTINATTGVLSFVAPPNFEAPTDSGGNNVYDVQITATDSGGLTDTQDIAVTVTNVSEGAVITSNGGGGLAVIRVSENFTGTLTTVTSTDDEGDARTYSISGGADAARFAIDSTTGVLTFVTSPNFEAPADANGDNGYEVTVRASSTGGADDQTLFVFVDNVIEPGVPTDVNYGGGGGGGNTTPGGGTAGPDNLVGSEGIDSLAGGDGADTLNGGGGDDWLDGDNGGDLILGGAGNDFIRGLNDDDLIYGGDGSDDVNGNLGQDFVDGGAGNDTVRGGQGADSVYGGDGDDGHVNGNIGDDQVFGGAGNDTVYGGQNNDTLYGEDGADRLSGDLGNDILYGGAGADRFAFAKGGGIDWVADFNFAEGDRILLTPGTAYTAVSVGGQVAISLGGGEMIGLVGTSFSAFSDSWVVFG